MLVRQRQKASANANWGVGSQPASERYQARIVLKGGYPPLMCGVVNSALVYSPSTVICSGCTRLARSERGCPIVDNSQSSNPIILGSV